MKRAEQARRRNRSWLVAFDSRDYLLRMTLTSSSLNSIRRVCVFCGSSTGTDPRFVEAARDMGGEIARRGWQLVWGGGRVGLMGAIADAVLAAGGTVIGVIPEQLATHELLHTGATEMHVVPSMHARKALMAELADAFVALPGGFGTFEELFEMITWGQLGIHRKPLGLFDVQEFYRPLIEFIDHAIKAGFIKEKQRGLVIAAAEAAELCDRLERQEIPTVRKWIKADET
jgi:uncharacterized protein (TIGR00730 family)